MKTRNRSNKAGRRNNIGQTAKTETKTPTPCSGRGLAQELQKNNQEGGLLIATNTMKQKAVSHETHQAPQKFRKRIGKNYYEVVVHFSDTSNENISDKITRLIRNEVANTKAVGQ